MENQGDVTWDRHTHTHTSHVDVITPNWGTYFSTACSLAARCSSLHQRPVWLAGYVGCSGSAAYQGCPTSDRPSCGRGTFSAEWRASVDLHRNTRFCEHVTRSRGSSADGYLVTFVWVDGCDGRVVHQRVVVRVDAVVQTDDSLGRQLSHPVVAGYDEVDATPEAVVLQVGHQEADVVVNLSSQSLSQRSSAQI